MKYSKRLSQRNMTRCVENDVKEHQMIQGEAVIDDMKVIPWTIYTKESVGQMENYPLYPYTEYSLYLYNQIMSPEYYSEVFHILRNANKGDVFHIYINSPGGDMTTLQSFSSAIDDSEATIICHIDGEVGSAAFVLAFMGDSIMISEFAQLMTHNQHLSVSRTDMANLKKYTDNSTAIYRNMLHRYCSKILSDDEISAICDDAKEIHLSAEECAARLEAWEKNNNETTELDDKPKKDKSKHKISKE